MEGRNYHAVTHIVPGRTLTVWDDSDNWTLEGRKAEVRPSHYRVASVRFKDVQRRQLIIPKSAALRALKPAS